MIRVTFANRKAQPQFLPGVCIVTHCFKPRHRGEKRCKSCLRERKAAEKSQREILVPA